MSAYFSTVNRKRESLSHQHMQLSRPCSHCFLFQKNSLFLTYSISEENIFFIHSQGISVVSRLEFNSMGTSTLPRKLKCFWIVWSTVGLCEDLDVVRNVSKEKFTYYYGKRTRKMQENLINGIVVFVRFQAQTK